MECSRCVHARAALQGEEKEPSAFQDAISKNSMQIEIIQRHNRYTQGTE